MGKHVFFKLSRQNFDMHSTLIFLIGKQAPTGERHNGELNLGQLTSELALLYHGLQQPFSSFRVC